MLIIKFLLEDATIGGTCVCAYMCFIFQSIQEHMFPFVVCRRHKPRGIFETMVLIIYRNTLSI